MTNTITVPRSRTPLRRVLLLDAVASGALGLVGVLGSSVLAGPLGLPAGLLLGVGVFLVVYALGLVGLARTAPVPRGLTLVVVLGNATWVLMSVALVIGVWSQLTVLGVVVVLVQAAAVAVFADLQYARR